MSTKHSFGHRGSMAIQPPHYGTVVQRTKLDGNYVLPYVHPCAIIYYLTSISKDFATFIDGVLDSQGAKPLNVLVYGDEMTPGNPLRHDEGRKA